MRTCLFAAATLLVLGAATRAEAEPFLLSTPVRVVAWSGDLGAADGFTGVDRQSFGRFASTGDGTVYADRFRADAITIWSGSTGSRWILLPPKRLGHEAEVDLAAAD